MARFWHKAYVTKFERLAYSPWMYSLKLSYLKKKERERKEKRDCPAECDIYRVVLSLDLMFKLNGL